MLNKGLGCLLFLAGVFALVLAGGLAVTLTGGPNDPGNIVGAIVLCLVGFTMTIGSMVILVRTGKPVVGAKPGRSAPPSPSRQSSKRSDDKGGEWVALDYEDGENDDPTRFNTKIVGVTQPGRQKLVMKCHAGERLQVVRERRNKHSKFAVMILRQDGSQLGYLSEFRAEMVAPLMDAGARYVATIDQLTGGTKESRGVNILVERVS